jgi:hypothetical protein
MAKRNGLKKRNSIWTFAVHTNPDGGPNRVSYTPNEARRFFINKLKQGWSGAIVTAKHNCTGLKIGFNTVDDFDFFVERLVGRTGIRK